MTELANIDQKQPGKRLRESSYDRSGGNKDYFTLRAGKTLTIFDKQEPGKINHIWMTMVGLSGDEAYLYRKIVLRMYWDDEQEPSVEAPIGDFFGMGHGITKNFVSAPFQMAPEDGQALNCYLPMPFKKARIEVEDQSNSDLKFYFYVDYVALDKVTNPMRFHAQWHRELTEDTANGREKNNAEFEFGGKNLAGQDNYVILDAKGSGQYIGTNLNIHNLRFTQEWNWYGEGDDMIFVDGDKTPTLKGTGMEDYFNTSWCPTQEYNSPYFGIILGGGPNWSGKVTYYHYHIQDPITFDQSIKVTIEHGHANHRSDDYASTAYWYQDEPHQAFQPLLPVEQRLPLPDVVEPTDKETEPYFNYPN